MQLIWAMPFERPAVSTAWPSPEIVDWTRGAAHRDASVRLERAGFVAIALDDTPVVPSRVDAGDPLALRVEPTLDPLPLLPLIARSTTRIGIIAGLSTNIYPPYLLARALASVDGLSGGRVGWSVQIGDGPSLSENLGREVSEDLDTLASVADEFIDIVVRLWKSWEPDALVANRALNIYTDHTKVHVLNHVGEHFSVRGPLNTLPSPQGEPVVSMTARTSQERMLAATYADIIVLPAQDADEFSAAMDHMEAALSRNGRRRADVRIYALISPVVAPTLREAMTRASARQNILEQRLSDVRDAYCIESTVGLIPDLANVPGTSVLAHLAAATPGATWSELLTGSPDPGVFVGSSDEVAAAMVSFQESTGADGFVISAAAAPSMPEYLASICDELVPELRSRGAIQDYSAVEPHLRASLYAIAPTPEKAPV